MCGKQRVSRNRRQIDSIIRVDRLRGSDSNDRLEQRREWLGKRREWGYLCGLTNVLKDT